MRLTSFAILLTMCLSQRVWCADPIVLRAGPVTMVFEPDNAFLRYIRVGPHEMLRGISAPVRDQYWGTVPPQVSNVRVDETGDSFVLSFDVGCKQRDVDFQWQGKIKGTVRGEIEYTFDGQARSNFLRNRIGFCVLHGPDAAGKVWMIENVRGEKSKGHFPSLISPHQPAKDIRAIVHELAPELTCEVRFEGEVFEMEDQRNWTDASFKTYCTPLAIPYPVRVTADARVQQKISIRLDGKIPGGDQPSSRRVGRVPSSELADTPIALTFVNREAPLPKLGVQQSSQTDDLSDVELARLRALKLDHLRVDLAPASPEFEVRLRKSSSHAQSLGLRLHVGLHLGPHPDQELKSLAAAVQRIRPPVAYWLVIGPNRQHFGLAREILADQKGTALLGFGHDTNFTELNRDRPHNEPIEAVSYGINPTIHAIDDASVVETLPIQMDTVRTAREFVGKRPLLVSPVTLRPQLVNQAPLPGELPSNIDARQPTLFNAAWTVGCIKYLGEAGADSITLFETVGWKGIMETSQGTSLPKMFPSQPGEVFAVYHVLRRVGDFAGGQVQAIESSDSLSMVALAIKKTGQRRVFIANLSNREKSATIPGLSGNAMVVQLDGRTISSWNSQPLIEYPVVRTPVQQPIVLLPHGIAIVDEQ